MPRDPYFEGVAEEDMGAPQNMLGVEPSESDRMDDVDENDVDEFDERQPRAKPKKAAAQPDLPAYRGGQPMMNEQEMYERKRLQEEAAKAAQREAEFLKMQEELMRQQQERKHQSARSVKQGTPASSKYDYTPPQLSDAEQFDHYGRPMAAPQRSEKKASPPKVIQLALLEDDFERQQEQERYEQRMMHHDVHEKSGGFWTPTLIAKCSQIGRRNLQDQKRYVMISEKYAQIKHQLLQEVKNSFGNLDDMYAAQKDV